jgi:hypothetical protein
MNGSALLLTALVLAQVEPQGASSVESAPSGGAGDTAAPAPPPRESASGVAVREGVKATRGVRDPAAERAEAERAARAFLAALARGDAEALTAAGAEKFSFDGEAQSGRDAVRRTWRSILAGRPGPAPAVGAIEILAAAEATARYGAPPARVAALARPGVHVAVGDVGGRSVVLFVAREGGRMAVLGMHD